MKPIVQISLDLTNIDEALETAASSRFTYSYFYFLYFLEFFSHGFSNWIYSA